MNSTIYNIVAHEYITFGFLDDIADTVFEVSALGKELQTKNTCRTCVKALYPCRLSNNSRLVTLSSTTVLRKVIRRSARVFSPFMDQYEKKMHREAQNLGLKMFRRV